MVNFLVIDYERLCRGGVHKLRMQPERKNSGLEIHKIPLDVEKDTASVYCQSRLQYGHTLLHPSRVMTYDILDECIHSRHLYIVTTKWDVIGL